MNVHLGYEIGTGASVEIPLGHLVVSGQTQLSGKTTTLEALVHRSNLRAIAFITKRGEGSFAGAREIPAFYRSPKSSVMWQYVSEVLQAKLGEKMKFERSWIMRVSKGAAHLWDVHRNVKQALKKDKMRELDRSVYEQLDAYFELVLPELQQIVGDRGHVPSFYLREGINVMRLEKFSTETQMLCVAAVLEHVYHHEEGVITIVPEAWEMVPQGRTTPVKAAAATMFRKGAGLRNFVWFDSQDLAGVDKQALKQVSVWILGVQREANEAERMIEHLDVGGPKPKLADVRTLGVGQFFASWGKELRKVYVQPWGVANETARRIAAGTESIAAAKNEMAISQRKDDSMYAEELAQARKEIAALKGLIQSYEKQMRDHGLPGFPPTPKAARQIPESPEQSEIIDEATIDAMYEGFKARLLREDPGAILNLIENRPEIRLKTRRKTYELDESTLRGRLALMIKKGFFDNGATGNSAFNDLSRRGIGSAKPNVYRELDELTKMGFLLKSNEGYTAIPEMKVELVAA